MAITIPKSFPDVGEVAGRRVVLTGASRGLGRVLAHAFSRAGARLVVAARDRHQLAELCRELPGEHVACDVDVTDAEANERLAARAIEELGGLDVWVGNAGISPLVAGPLETPPEVWRAILDVNLTGAFLGARAAAGVMTGGGSIIVTTSVLGERPRRGLAAYAASKAGAGAMVKALAQDLAAQGIRVNAVAPGWFESPLADGFMRNEQLSNEILGHTVQRRWGRPEDLAGAYLFLASDASAYLTGTTVNVDGGYLCV